MVSTSRSIHLFSSYEDMASIAFPLLAKSLSLTTAHTYSYAYNSPAHPSLPILLFLHGFPSSSYDWRHQVQFFSAQGFGVLAPDLLGYGDTSKPWTLESYKAKTMAAEIIEILDHEGIDKVHAVAHDTGCTLLSRLANYFPGRLLSCTFLDVPYSRPGDHFDLAAVNALTKQFLGLERFGYVEFFVRPDAGDILDQHSDSFFTLFYPQDPELWIEHVGPKGAMETWLLQDRTAPQPAYICEEERKIHQDIMRNNHGPALNWYRALVSNINEKDEIQSNLDPTLPMPVLMICPQPTKMELPGIAEQLKQVAPDLTFRRVSTTGHWVQLEAPNEINTVLKEFFERQKK
ncbi:alpha/beta fold hydrolase [Aspergillus foveolatus]|uniref:alpha/beta fold hydrolase n=1 Tax=Aspergillus foveolatus TaxID=210207 RepID=UPI003CCCD743